ncbi:MAG: hypothetical protein JO362_07975 [Streptomycetaceae bacterium]|nr:hypothetical protein [Streptomycetaceae bacterium]
MSTLHNFNDLFKDSASTLAEARTSTGKPEKVRPKYAQIRADQWTDLDELARELMDARTAKGRRITANSLIRVAIDALLADRDNLVGNDEEQIRANYLKKLGLVKDEMPGEQDFRST